MAESFPEGYKYENGIVWGSRVPGLLEIKFHSPKTKNSTSMAGQQTIADIVNSAQTDQNVKVILLQGGKTYSSGNDLSVMIEGLRTRDRESFAKLAHEGINVQMVNALKAINSSVKPTVAVVRGNSVGIGFTTLALVDFVYAAPNALFKAPFVESF